MEKKNKIPLLLKKRGLEVWGNEEKFLKWMNNPCLVFEFEKPIDLITNEEGLSKVFDEIGRIEHGVLA